MDADDLLRCMLECTGAPQDKVGWVLSEVIEAYSSPLRAYHNLAHIADLLRLVDADAAILHEPHTVRLAVIFHDVVYDPRRSDNEVRSADWAAQRLVWLGVPDAQVARTMFLIDMTRHGISEPAADDSDLIRFLDFDLSVLGAAEAAYEAYAAAIRQEYAHLSDVDYRDGRMRVLRMFLGPMAIYRSADLAVRWEAQARRNLAQELLSLEAAA